MAFGIISVIFGVIIFIVSLFMESSTVMQQQVQHIDFVIAAIFLIGGVIILYLKSGIDRIEWIHIKLDKILRAATDIHQKTIDSGEQANENIVSPKPENSDLKILLK